MGTTSVTRRRAIVAGTTLTAVGELSVTLAIVVASTRSAEAARLADRLSRDFTSIKSTTVSAVTGTREARTISLTVASSRAIRVGCTRANADTGGYIAKGLTGSFTTIVIAVSIDPAGVADTIGLTIVSLGIDTIAVLGTSRDTEAGNGVTVRLVGDFTTISSSTSGDTSAAQAGQIGLTVVTSTASRLAACIVSAHEGSLAKAKRDVALGLARNHTSIKSTTIGIRETSTARTVSLTVVTSGSSTISVLGARTTDTGAYITNLLSRGFTTIEGTTVGVGSASKASLVSLTVATRLTNAAGVVGANEWVNADTSPNAALYLSSLFTTIKGTAVSIGSTFDARTISLTVGEIQTTTERTAISIG